jgi:hypothetical protein
MRLVFSMLQPLTPQEQHTLVALVQKVVTSLPELPSEPSSAQLTMLEGASHGNPTS